jgi:hypothetical protein
MNAIHKGKHNYFKAFNRGKDVVEGFNTNTPINPYIDYIVNFLKLHSYNFVKLIHTESNQSEGGDILGYTKDGKVYKIELKICETAKDTESHGGVSGDFFKFLDINITGYREFESKVGVDKKRWNIINHFLGTNISSYEEQDELESTIKQNKSLLDELRKVTNEVKEQYQDYLVEVLNTIDPQKIINLGNAIYLGERKNLQEIKSVENNILEIQVGFFGTEKQVISSKTFTPKTQLKNIYRKRLALVLEFENGFIKFPLIHGNAYQGSGRTLSFKCMFKY